jgi:hypothetical protein
LNLIRGKLSGVESREIAITDGVESISRFQETVKTHKNARQASDKGFTKNERRQHEKR